MSLVFFWYYGPMNWKLIVLSALGGWSLQFALFALSTRQWVMKPLFPGVDGWGYWAAGLALAYGFLYVVLPATTLGVFLFVYRKGSERKWQQALLVAAFNTLPALLVVSLQFF